MKKTHLIAAAAAQIVILAISGCTSQSLEESYSKMEDTISSYIESNFSDETRYAIHRYGGSSRITVIPQPEEPETPENAPATGASATDTLKQNGKVTFDYAGFILGNSFPPTDMFTASTKELADEGGLWGDETTFTPVTVRLSDGNLLEGLRKGLLGVSEGEECYIIFSAKYGFGNMTVNAIPKMSSLIYHIWVLDIEN